MPLPTPPLPIADIDSFMKEKSLAHVSLKSWVKILAAAGTCIFIGWVGHTMLMPSAPIPPVATYSVPSYVSPTPCAAVNRYTLVTRPITHKSAKNVGECVEKFRRAFSGIGVSDPAPAIFSTDTQDYELSFQTNDEKVVVSCYKDAQSKLVMSNGAVEHINRATAINRWTLILAKLP